jgi:uncharacterized BrkB/YihY/UPF0761 family membrane protein
VADNSSPVILAPTAALKMTDYPVLVTIVAIVVFTAILLVVADRFDPTKGPLTISLIVVLGFISTVTFSLLYTIPNDEITSAAAGGLISAFGATLAFWLYRKSSGDK